MALTKVGPKYQVTIPKAERKAAGIKVGDLVEASVRNGVVMLRPKIVMDRDPELERDLEAAERAVREGRVLGPFNSASAAMRALKAYKPARRGGRRAHARSSD